jgi:hypothetical protein
LLLPAADTPSSYPPTHKYSGALAFDISEDWWKDVTGGSNLEIHFEYLQREETYEVAGKLPKVRT